MPLIAGARQLPVQHLSIRVPWHDAGWDGTVCRRPRENTSCLILKGVAERKDDDAEERCAGCKWSELEDKLPACAAERGSFMAPFEFTHVAEHPYAKSSRTHEHFLPTPFRHPPYSAACIPFRWMLRGEVEGDQDREGLAAKLLLDYRLEREPELSFEANWINERREPPGAARHLFRRRPAQGVALLLLREAHAPRG